MMRVKTLKSLYPEPQPPSSKNFIKENVKSVRKMEKLFHTNSTAKGPNFPISKQPKTLRKTTSHKNNIHTKEDPHGQKTEEIIQNGMAKFKPFHENQSVRKKSTPVVLNKKGTMKKNRQSINENMIRKTHETGDQDGCRMEDKKLKALSKGDISCEKFNEELTSDMKIKCKSQGVQTLNSDDVESIYSDGVIRYPSAKNKESQTPKSMDRGDTEVQENNESNVKHNSELLSNDCIDHIKMNKERVSLASKLASQLNNSAPSTGHRVGVVPKY